MILNCFILWTLKIEIIYNLNWFSLVVWKLGFLSITPKAYDFGWLTGCESNIKGEVYWSHQAVALCGLAKGVQSNAPFE